MVNCGEKYYRTLPEERERESSVFVYRNKQALPEEYSDSHAVWSICLFSQIELEWYSREHFSAIDLAFLSTFRSTIPICSPKDFVL